MKQRHPADPPQWKSKHLWKSKKNNGTTTLTQKMRIGIRAGAAKKKAVKIDKLIIMDMKIDKVKDEEKIGGTIHTSNSLQLTRTRKRK